MKVKLDSIVEMLTQVYKNDNINIISLCVPRVLKSKGLCLLGLLPLVSLVSKGIPYENYLEESISVKILETSRVQFDF